MRLLDYSAKWNVDLCRDGSALDRNRIEKHQLLMADKSTQKAVENSDRSPFSTLKTLCPALCRQEAVQRSL